MAKAFDHRIAYFLVLIALALSAVDARAQQARMGLYWDNQGSDCHLSTGSTSAVRAYIVVTKTLPFKSLGFKAQVPAGVTWVSDTFAEYFDATGSNTQTGCVIKWTGNDCYKNSSAYLGYITYTAPTTLPPTSWEVTGTFQPKFELKDCDGKNMTGVGSTAWLNNPGATCSRYQYLAPYFPSPQGDSAPVNSKLSFNGDANRIWLSTEPFETPGEEDLVCATAGGASCPNPFDPGLLQPYTTYYWMAGNVCDPPSEDCEDALSDLWTFTTGDATVAVRTSTWGAIKALYR